jgi:glycine/D-amino acid oxidase-like deaminating enzyme
MAHYESIVVGGGVIGVSIAYHLARLGQRRVLLVERGRVGEGTTAQSSCILRTHYTVPQNVLLAQAAWRVYEDFAGYLDDREADCGLVRCGYLIAAPPGEKSAALAAALAAQRGFGIHAEAIDARAARALLPIAAFADAELIGYEPDAGFADAYLVTSAFARNARRLGAAVREHTAVTGLVRSAGRITGVVCGAETIGADNVICAQNVWSGEVARWTGVALPLTIERHAVMSLQTKAAPYTRAMPVFKDLAVPGLLYCRSYGGAQMLVSEGTPGEVLGGPDTVQADVALDKVLGVGEQVASRFPAYAEAALASSWTGLYDVTPDWNPVLGPLPGHDGLWLAYGFSGHGFKLAPAVGLVMAQAVLGQPCSVPIDAYSASRFAQGRSLTGRYGAGAVS